MNIKRLVKIIAASFVLFVTVLITDKLVPDTASFKNYSDYSDWLYSNKSNQFQEFDSGLYHFKVLLNSKNTKALFINNVGLDSLSQGKRIRLQEMGDGVNISVTIAVSYSPNIKEYDKIKNIDILTPVAFNSNGEKLLANFRNNLHKQFFVVNNNGDKFFPEVAFVERSFGFDRETIVNLVFPTINFPNKVVEVGIKKFLNQEVNEMISFNNPLLKVKV